ncbi:MAG: hypothetical protein NT094_00255, partial [Candidatus Staskawiczbacteria bacterium]|nr:hypothetical protein [Candidatus Staskawiczbacteria bacterium]
TVNFSCTSTGCPVTTDWRPSSISCGDTVCNGTETCSTCPADCGVCPYCGDGVCNNGEVCNVCVADCGTCGGCTVYHNECNSQKQCISLCGSESDLCSTSDNCATHNICNAQEKCVSTSGIGSDQCTSDGGCIIKHTECNNLQCVSINGSGTDQCQTNADCPKHNDCNAQNQCAAITGVGNDLCLVDGDCVKTHTECNYQNQCVTVNGVGINQCLTDKNCAPPKHNECTLQDQCVVVDGAGIDQCQTNGDCQPVRHNECNAQNQCVLVNGAGNDQCKIDGDCLATHNECSGSQCMPIIGIGIDQCSSNGDCPTHNECNEQKKCIVVGGSSTNDCLTDDDCGPIIVTHNECDTEKQCLSVPGAGTDQCSSGDDCITHSVCNLQNQCVSKNGVGSDECKIDKDCDIAKTIILKTKKTIDSPQGSVITKTVSTTGLLVTTVATTVATIGFFSLFDLFLILSRLFNFLLVLTGLKKKGLPWGVVYDSVTKRPLDPAYVVLKNTQGKEISSAITDLDGRFGFLVEQGIYQMEAHKTNYIFPSQKLAGRTQDELYKDLYFGENIEVKKSGDVIIKNIPLDPVKFDWNEFEKKKKGLMVFYSKWDSTLRKIYDLLFIIGLIVAVVSYIFAPYPYNAIVVTLYLLFLLFRVLGLKPKTYGYITDKTTGNPLSFAIIRVALPDSNVEVASKSADKYGKYYCLVSPGKYYVKIEKKNEDGSYSSVYTSQIIDVSKKGIIKEKFKV